MERFPENESESKSGKPINFDEPHEWLAKLSSSDQQQSQQCATNQQTPRMTPKKTVRPNTTSSEHDCGKTSPAEDEMQTVACDGRLPQTNSFQLNDELMIAENIVASVVVDVDKEGIQLSEADRDELGGMMVSLSVELESVDATAPASEETVRQEIVAVAACPLKASACGQRGKNHQNCTLKKAHHLHKTGTLCI